MTVEKWPVVQAFGYDEPGTQEPTMVLLVGLWVRFLDDFYGVPLRGGITLLVWGEAKAPL